MGIILFEHLGSQRPFVMISFNLLKKYHSRSLFLVVTPLILSSFTHLWNPIGFPAIWVVEGQYMQRAMSLLNGFNLEDSKDINPHLYDHPFFGQIFLGGVLALMGYPDLFSTNNPSSEIEIDNTIKTFYSVPRILMGLLAVVDTYLVYKIAERRYNKTIAFIAAVLFAVMPITWILREILLESILLPFLLLSILFALYGNKDSICFKFNRIIWRSKIGKAKVPGPNSGQGLPIIVKARNVNLIDLIPCYLNINKIVASISFYIMTIRVAWNSI
jgi:hypothetical protein